ncbi:MAG: winged helix-turn-helix domain-containing protein [Nitrospinota bacterium]
MPSDRSSKRSRRRRAPRLAVRSQVWLEVDGRRVFSVGRMQLLEAIEAEGSIQKASERLGMSYRAAWGKLKATEEALGIVLLERSIGGPKGGGARLTAAARDLMARYRSCWEAVNTAADRSFAKAFTGKSPRGPTRTKSSSRR